MNNIMAASTLIFIAVVASGIYITYNSQEPDYKFSGPADTVRQYFSSWDSGYWANMYAAVSDGFKKIEPTAKTLPDFKQHIQQQNISAVKIVSIKEKSNNGMEAVVEYIVEFTSSNKASKSVSGSFVLKNRQNDIIRGWKLVQPYGDSVDNG